ncbi:hypothetical protein SAHL_04935 [Salinisphaera orenii YIM 95161]|uniref:Cystathionine gamma-synthase n=2 Tax=Salinisphaera TaxID=180541 RepID=A0A423Q1X1_9GAMM|nr:hypothetical protein SAHL_04935 [Salinisphaera halophila YIM 95161]
MDLEAIRSQFPNAVIIYDNTFQGLVNDKGQAEFADIIVGSCTKYIGGHNDLLAGYVSCADSEIYQKIWSARSSFGGILDNLSAYLLFRSLRTYDIRIAKGLENCLQVINFLEKSSAVVDIYYPGRNANRDQAELLERTQFHGGSVVTFRVEESVQLEDKFNRLNSTKMAPSFGSVDTLIEIPAYMSHWGKTLEELQELGLDFRTVRLSVGNEPVSYILDDLRILLE